MIRHITTRYDILRNGAKLGELQAVDTPSVEMEADAQVKMSLSGTFVQNDLLDIWSDRIQPNLIINGQEYPLGEYVITEVSNSRTEQGGAVIDLGGYDQGIIVKNARLENPVLFERGRLYTDIIQSLLIQNKIGKILCVDSPLQLQTDRSDWEIGTSYIDIVNTLLQEINYNSLWFDQNGFARLSPYQLPVAENITMRYQSGTLIKPEYSISINDMNTPNVFIATVENPEYEEPLEARAENNRPNSPLSTIRRGRIPEFVKLDNISSREELQKYVDNKVFKSMISTETVEFVTAINGNHGVGDIIALDIPGLSGIFQETGWTLSLSYDGDMKHRAKRVNYL